MLTEAWGKIEDQEVKMCTKLNKDMVKLLIDCFNIASLKRSLYTCATSFSVEFQESLNHTFLEEMYALVQPNKLNFNKSMV